MENVKPLFIELNPWETSMDGWFRDKVL